MKLNKEEILIGLDYSIVWLPFQDTQDNKKS